MRRYWVEESTRGKAVGWYCCLVTQKKRKMKECIIQFLIFSWKYSNSSLYGIQGKFIMFKV